MSKLSRRDFFMFTAALAGAYTVKRIPLPSLLAQQSVSGRIYAEPDLIVVNGRVFTVDPAQPRAEAFAIKDGRFIAVGSTADIRNLAKQRTQVIDAQRMTVTPRFIDAHCHPSGINELYEVNTNLRSIKEIQEALKKRAATLPPDQWVVGTMFDDTKLTDDHPLNRFDLDAAVSDHPVVVNHRGGHTSWYNTRALELAEISRRTPDPEHGRFFRDANGELTGRVAELARQVFNTVGKRPQFTPEQQRERSRSGMRYISELLTAAGLTTVHDAGTSLEKVTAYEDTFRNGELRHRAYMMIRGDNIVRSFYGTGLYTGFGNEWIRVGGIKFTADGSASERTMRMSTPYVGTDDHGILTMTQDQIYAAVDEAHRRGFQVGVHANGDVTIDMVLKAYERALAQWPNPDRRHRIEHCTLVNPDLIRRIKAVGAIPTPFWTYVYYHGEKWSEYGAEKLKWMFAHRSFVDAGIHVPGASDYGPGPFEPMMAIQSMVTRKDYKGKEWGTNQKVTVDEALKIGTINGAYASHEENVKGSITPGKLADFVILEKDPHEVNPDEIKDIKIVRTVVGGKTMHPKG